MLLNKRNGYLSMLKKISFALSALVLFSLDFACTAEYEVFDITGKKYGSLPESYTKDQ